jgi:hypothetical protein
MRTSNPDRLTAATAEQLLDGGPGPAGLHQLLAAAAGPGTASELAGETAAVAAFVGAPRENPLPSAPTRRPSMLSTALSKILAAKALAAVVLLAGATGGVALAANASSAPSSSDETSAASTATADAGSSGGEDAGAGEPTAPGPDTSTAPSPEPSILGLCRAWSAGATDNPGKAAENPAFRSLVEAAGSVEDVPGFCSVRERTEQPGRSTTAPGRAEDRDPTTGDDAGPTAGKSGPPTAAPGNPDHPAGPPAGRAARDGDERDGDEEDGDDSGRDAGNGKESKDGDEGEDAKGGGAESKQDGQGSGADRAGRSAS